MPHTKLVNKIQNFPSTEVTERNLSSEVISNQKSNDN